jgi:signal transduction histidine kinase
VNQLQATTRSYIAALLILAVSLTFLTVSRTPLLRPTELLIAGVVTACTGLAWLFPIHFAPGTKLYAADTAVMVAAVLLLPPAFAVIAMGSGTLLAHVARRASRDWAEALFNTAQMMLITLAVALLVALADWDPTRIAFPGIWPLLIILVMALVIFLLNVFLMAMITAFEAQRPIVESFRGALLEDLGFEAAAHASLVATGVIAAILVRAHPWAVVLLAVPIIGTYAMLRHQARLRQGAERARMMSDAALIEAQRLAHLGSWKWYPATDRWVWSDEVYSLLGLDPRSEFPTLQAMVNAVHQADRAKSQLLSMASHELRTPLTAIQGYIEMVVGDRASELSEEQREFLGVAHRNTLQLAGLVNDLLDLARIEAGRLPLQVAPVDVEAAAREVLETLMPHATAKGIRLEFAVNGPEPQVVLVDPARFNQVLLNLVGNAVKFTERGSVTISTRAVDDWVEITVSDTGPGIPTESLPHVFEAFNQGCAPAMRQDGAGLGLAIVKQIVDLHGGSIAVRSVAGNGSTFTLRLPAASQPAEPAA